MLSALLEGFVTGLFLSMSFGPVFFMLIQTSIQKGVNSALYFDVGVLVSDLTYIVLAFYGASIVFDNPVYTDWISIIGGSVLIIIGFWPLLFSKAQEPVDHEIRQVARLDNTRLMAKGFLVNFLNPTMLFIWFGTTALVFSRYQDTPEAIYAYFFATLATYFGIDVGKVYLAIKLRRIINPKALQFIHRLSGIIIIGFGLYLIITHIDYLKNLLRLAD